MLFRSEALEELLHDPEIAVRIAAAEAIYHLENTDKALSVLRSALDHPNLMARVQALNVLESMKKEAAPALQELADWNFDNIQDGEYDRTAAKRLVDQLR